MTDDEREERLRLYRLSRAFDALAKAKGVEFLHIRMRGGEVLTWDEGVFSALGDSTHRRLDWEEVREILIAEGVDPYDDSTLDDDTEEQTGTVDSAEPLAELVALLREQFENRKRVEEQTRQWLETTRESHSNDRRFAERFSRVHPLTGVALDMIAASARGLAASEAAFGAAVESREAVEKLLRELNVDPDG